jgi:hypothetical protein
VAAVELNSVSQLHAMLDSGADEATINTQIAAHFAATEPAMATTATATTTPTMAAAAMPAVVPSSVDDLVAQTAALQSVDDLAAQIAALQAHLTPPAPVPLYSPSSSVLSSSSSTPSAADSAAVAAELAAYQYFMAPAAMPCYATAPSPAAVYSNPYTAAPSPMQLYASEHEQRRRRACFGA